jgi:regulator of protease activity HflC (stomatin/prohibitin superfamily)
MKTKLLQISVIVGLLAMTGACGWTTVEPGHVGIVVNMTGSDRGVSSYTPTTGRVFYNWVNTSVFQYPTYVQNAVWTANKSEGKPTDESITFTTKDSMAVNADFNVSYELLADKVPAFYVKFRNDDIQGFTDGYMHNISRDCINRVAGLYDVEQIMGDNAPFLDAARNCVQKELESIGVKIDSFGLIGAPRPPETVISSINLKVQAQQIALQKQNEVMQAEADAKKRVADAEGWANYHRTLADGEAQANRTIAASLSPEVLEWRRLSITEQAVNKWNGQRPSVEGAGSGLLLSISPK